MPATDASPPIVSARPFAIPLPDALPVTRLRSSTLFLIAALTLGFGVRVAAFTSVRPLWIDEAMLALNVVDRAPAELFAPLDHNQAAPVGFLLLVKLSVATFGPSEWALRLVPFVGSLFGLLAFAAAATHWLPSTTARLAVLLFAVSPTVVSYSNEAKQYSTDAAISAGLLAYVPPLIRRNAPSWRWVLTAWAGGAAVWLSFPAVFVLGGLGLVLLAKADRRATVLTVTAWATSFAAMYTVHLRHVSGNRFLSEYWSGHFLPISPSVAEWLVERTIELFQTAGGYGGDLFEAAGLAAVVAAIGGVALIKSERQWQFGAIGAVVGLTLLASALQLYPFYGRLLLFLTPVTVLLVASGGVAISNALAGWYRPAGWIVPTVLVAAPLADVVHQFRHPPRCEDLPAVLAFVHERWQEGDRVYVYNGHGDTGAGPAFRYYSRHDPLPTEAVVLGGEHRGDWLKYRDEVYALPRPSRVWVLFSHRHRDEESVIRAYFDAIGERGNEFAGTGAAVYEYRLR